MLYQVGVSFDLYYDARKHKIKIKKKKYPSFFLDFNETNFPEIFSKSHNIQNFLKTCSLGAEFFPAGGRTDKEKLTVAFRSVAHAPTKLI